jgi:hypothetical protein
VQLLEWWLLVVGRSGRLLTGQRVEIVLKGDAGQVGEVHGTIDRLVNAVEMARSEHAMNGQLLQGLGDFVTDVGILQASLLVRCFVVEPSAVCRILGRLKELLGLIEKLLVGLDEALGQGGIGLGIAFGHGLEQLLANGLALGLQVGTNHAELLLGVILGSVQAKPFDAALVFPVHPLGHNGMDSRIELADGRDLNQKDKRFEDQIPRKKRTMSTSLSATLSFFCSVLSTRACLPGRLNVSDEEDDESAVGAFLRFIFSLKKQKQRMSIWGKKCTNQRD